MLIQLLIQTDTVIVDTAHPLAAARRAQQSGAVVEHTAGGPNAIWPRCAALCFQQHAKMACHDTERCSGAAGDCRPADYNSLTVYNFNPQTHPYMSTKTCMPTQDI